MSSKTAKRIAAKFGRRITVDGVKYFWRVSGNSVDIFNPLTRESFGTASTELVGEDASDFAVTPGMIAGYIKTQPQHQPRQGA